MNPSVLQIICRLPANAECFDFIIKFNFFLKSDFKSRNGLKRAIHPLGIINIQLIQFVRGIKGLIFYRKKFSLYL